MPVCVYLAFTRPSPRGYPDGMVATDPVTPEPRRFAVRLLRPLWIGVAAGVLIVVGGGAPVRAADLPATGGGSGDRAAGRDG